MRDVRTETGISASNTIRAPASTAIRNSAPSRTDPGIRRLTEPPNSIRAACGIRSPTQPTRPQSATMEDVIRAEARIAVNLRRLTEIPSDRASSSGSESAASFQR